MTRQEFDAKWAAISRQERDEWLWGRLVEGAPARLRGDAPWEIVSPDAAMLAAIAAEEEVERRGLHETYALTLADLVEEGHEYGTRSRGIQYWRLAHASAEQRCKAALMTVLEVET